MKSYYKLSIVSAVVLPLMACDPQHGSAVDAWGNQSVGYVPLNTGSDLSRGYWEERLGPQSYRVGVKGGSVDRRSRIKDMALRRAAELAKEEGARTFLIRDVEEGMVCEKGSNTSDPKIELTVEFGSDTPESGSGTFDVEKTLASFANVLILPDPGVRERLDIVRENRMRCGFVYRYNS